MRVSEPELELSVLVHTGAGKLTRGAQNTRTKQKTGDVLRLDVRQTGSGSVVIKNGRRLTQTEFYVLLSCRVNVTLLLEELPLLGNLFSDDRLSDLAVILLNSHWWQLKCDFFFGVRTGRHLVQPPKTPKLPVSVHHFEPFGSFKHCSDH